MYSYNINKNELLSEYKYLSVNDIVPKELLSQKLDYLRLNINYINYKNKLHKNIFKALISIFKRQRVKYSYNCIRNYLINLKLTRQERKKKLLNKVIKLCIKNKKKIAFDMIKKFSKKSLLMERVNIFKMNKFYKTWANVYRSTKFSKIIYNVLFKKVKFFSNSRFLEE